MTLFDFFFLLDYYLMKIGWAGFARRYYAATRLLIFILYYDASVGEFYLILVFRKDLY